MQIEVKKIWSSIAKDLWVAILDVIAVNAAYFLALLVRFFDNVEFRPADCGILATYG